MVFRVMRLNNLVLLLFWSIIMTSVLKVEAEFSVKC